MSATYRRIWGAGVFGPDLPRKLPVRQREGTPCELEIAIAPVRDSKGHIANLVCNGRDASDSENWKPRSATHEEWTRSGPWRVA